LSAQSRFGQLFLELKGLSVTPAGLLYFVKIFFESLIVINEGNESVQAFYQGRGYSAEQRISMGKCLIENFEEK